MVILQRDYTVYTNCDELKSRCREMSYLGNFADTSTVKEKIYKNLHQVSSKIKASLARESNQLM